MPLHVTNIYIISYTVTVFLGNFRNHSKAKFESLIVTLQTQERNIALEEVIVEVKMEGQPHPYVPTDLILPDYVPVSLSQSTIVSIYGLSSLFVVSLIWVISGSVPKLAKIDRLLMCWWAFTGLTHIILEGYFAFTPDFYKDKTSFYLAEVWKEYSKGDSRYAGRNSDIVTVEALTSAIEGPACLLAVYAIAARKSYSYILQFAISLGQLYGTAVYFITAILDGDKFATSEFYYYAYYVLANSFWIIIPLPIAIRCWKKICASVQAESEKKTKRH